MENPQHFAFNENLELLDGPRTIICTGLGRSGTSAVASLLEILGVWLGVSETSRNRENKQLIRALRDGPEAAKRLIAEYDARFPVWGFKAPALRKGLKDTLDLFRNPLVVVPHRDVVGRLSRQIVSGGRQLTFTSLQESIRNQARLLEQLQRTSAPQLHISFSLLTSAPEEAAKAVAAFAGLEVPDVNLKEHMEMARQRYLSEPVKKKRGKAAKSDEQKAIATAKMKKEKALPQDPSKQSN